MKTKSKMWKISIPSRLVDELKFGFRILTTQINQSARLKQNTTKFEYKLTPNMPIMRHPFVD